MHACMLIGRTSRCLQQINRMRNCKIESYREIGASTVCRSISSESNHDTVAPFSLIRINHSILHISSIVQNTPCFTYNLQPFKSYSFSNIKIAPILPVFSSDFHRMFRISCCIYLFLSVNIIKFCNWDATITVQIHAK